MTQCCLKPSSLSQHGGVGKAPLLGSKSMPDLDDLDFGVERKPKICQPRALRLAREWLLFAFIRCEQKAEGNIAVVCWNLWICFGISGVEI